MRDAGYQGGHHDRCLPGTRESVLQDILCWAQTPQNQTVFWLNGLAGTGKSTIAQSISEVLAKKGLLGATFFCSRDFLDRRVLKKVFPTLAYQLACHFPHFRDHVIKVIKEDPTIAHTSLISQFENLLVKPLSEGNVSCIILIDALDECIDDQPSSALLSVLGRFVKELPRMKFFITGRPEPRIRTGFRLPLLEPLTQIFLLHEVQVAQVHQDIQLYLTQRLTTIARQRSDLDLPNPWPSDNEIEALTKKSSGLFIFASTMIRFIESEHHEPNERLQLLLSRTSGTSHEGRAGVDSLYSEILLQAFSDVEDPELFVDIRRVLGAIILAFNPLSRKELSVLLGVPTSLISTTLRHLHSVMLIPTDKHQKIRVFHKSFPDFIQDRKRCTNFNFRINPTTYHGSMAFSCLELVKKLKVNPCGLPPFTRNQDVRNLQQLLENKLGGAVRYACSYWARHLNLSWSLDTHTTINLITTMLEGATPWIEVMSLENNLGEVIHAMYSLLDWLDKVRFFCQPINKDLFLTTILTQDTRWEIFLEFVGERLPAVDDVLLPSHPRVRATNISHRLTYATGDVPAALGPPTEDRRQPDMSRGRPPWSSPQLGVTSNDDRCQTEAAHFHHNLRPEDRCCVRRYRERLLRSDVHPRTVITCSRARHEGTRIRRRIHSVSRTSSIRDFVGPSDGRTHRHLHHTITDNRYGGFPDGRSCRLWPVRRLCRVLGYSLQKGGKSSERRTTGSHPLVVPCGTRSCEQEFCSRFQRRSR